MNARLDLTLRDHFAAMAMQGLVTSGEYCGGCLPAREAYDIADAMPEQRKSAAAQAWEEG